MDIQRETNPVMVSVRCATYNHVAYIRQCLEGFVRQETNFRYEVIVHDDASTDGTTDIVREYAERYPDIIKPMYETENQYSKNLPAMNDAINARLVGKYVALCEGDDYWIDSNKLQKQFDYMESHPECSMCFHPHYNLYSDGKKNIQRPKIIKQFYSISDFIWRGAEFIATNSIFFHRKYYLNYDERPIFWKYSPVGDAPLALYLALNGRVGYLNDVFSVYRVQSSESWTSRNKSVSILWSSTKSALIMHKRFDVYTKKRYWGWVLLKKARIMIRFIRGVLGL